MEQSVKGPEEKRGLGGLTKDHSYNVSLYAGPGFDPLVALSQMFWVSRPGVLAHPGSIPRYVPLFCFSRVKGGGKEMKPVLIFCGV